MEPNPDYGNAELEMRYLFKDGSIRAIAQSPMRFLGKDKDSVVAALANRDFDTLKKLSVPAYRKTTTPA